VTDLASLTVDDFAPRVGEPFTLPDGTPYVLVEATLLAGAPGAPRPPFTLTFSGPPSPVRPQGIETLTNAALGTIDIFLVPLAQTAEGVRYEAIFA
jgi:hypothetical protein